MEPAVKTLTSLNIEYIGAYKRIYLIGVIKTLFVLVADGWHYNVAIQEAKTEKLNTWFEGKGKD